MSFKGSNKDTNSVLENHKEFIKDSAIIHGLLLKSPSNEIVNIPVTLFPSPFPQELFSSVARIQKDFHILFNRISRDHEILHQILKKVIEKDDFIKHLWDIYSAIRADKSFQPIFLSLVRNDYMICLPKECENFKKGFSKLTKRPGVSLKQIEYNLIASSFAGIAQKIVDFHKLNLSLVEVKKSEINEKIPSNHPADGFARGLICAWEMYNKQNSRILFLVSEKELNIYDHRIIEQCIYQQNPSIIVIRKTFQECFKEGKIESDNSLWINDHEISVVYFRHGFSPDHFDNEETWEAKLMLEKSKAIKSPSIQQMLVNTKLVQQALCNYTLLKRYLPDLVARELNETFANQYLLTDIDKVEAALQFPHQYVLKPQREGGGNNFFDDELVTVLKKVKDTEEKYQYVLMERIYPAATENYILKRDGTFYNETTVSELGIYGVFLGNENEIFANFQCGHLLRSKPVDVMESGVSAGYGCIDSPYLI